MANRRQRTKDQVALAVDQYGGTARLFSMEIIKELDQVADLQTCVRNNWVRWAGRLGFWMEE